MSIFKSAVEDIGGLARPSAVDAENNIRIQRNAGSGRALAHLDRAGQNGLERQSISSVQRQVAHTVRIDNNFDGRGHRVNRGGRSRDLEYLLHFTHTHPEIDTNSALHLYKYARALNGVEAGCLTADLVASGSQIGKDIVTSLVRFDLFYVTIGFVCGRHIHLGNAGAGRVSYRSKDHAITLCKQDRRGNNDGEYTKVSAHVLPFQLPSPNFGSMYFMLETRLYQRDAIPDAMKMSS